LNRLCQLNRMHDDIFKMCVCVCVCVCVLKFEKRILLYANYLEYFMIVYINETFNSVYVIMIVYYSSYTLCIIMYL